MSEQTKLPAIFHGANDQEGRLFTRLRHSDNGTYLYMVQNGDVTMYEVFKAEIFEFDGKVSFKYPDRISFGKTAFGIADPIEADRLFEMLSLEINQPIII